MKSIFIIHLVVLVTVNATRNSTRSPSQTVTKISPESVDGCQVLVNEYMMPKGQESNPLPSEYVCVIAAAKNNGTSGMTIPLHLSQEQHDALDKKLETGELVSGHATFHDINPTITENGIEVTSTELVEKDHENSGILSSLNSYFLQGVKADLTSTGMSISDNHKGDHYYIGVKVHALDHTHPDSLEEMSDNIFGTYGDPNNLKSQLNDCSYGQYNLIPGAKPGTEDISEHEKAPGMIEVYIDMTLENNAVSDVENAVTEAVQELLGFDLPGPFDYVMYIIENCYDGCVYAAYAYVNSWNSLYLNDNYKYSGVLMHEFGHNLGFAHSGGLDGNTYTDHTCLMGNPLWSDDTGKMCFNPAKNWQLGWYGDDYATVDPIAERCSEFTLMGIGEWDNGVYGHIVDLKIETGTENDYFIGFNRAVGPNADNVEADNEVTVYEAGANGNDYSKSSLKAHLISGESYTISNWVGTGEDLVLTVDNIDISNTPGTATVKVRLGESCTEAPTSTHPPSLAPSIQTLFEVSVEMKTDKWAQESSWEITTVADPTNVLMSDSGYYSNYISSKTGMLTCGPTYLFTMKDTYGDGMCCSEGEGYYTLTVEGSVIKNGGEFSKEESTEFSGGCLQSTVAPVSSSTSPSVAPVVSPTPSPTEVSPTPAPTSEQGPSVAPVVSPTPPTPAPTSEQGPSVAPVVSPTSPTEVSPTPAPTEVSPTPSPTSEQGTCIECSNDVTPKMPENGKTCEDLSDNKLRDKCNSSKYINNNYCQLSCYLALHEDDGYEGVVCCTEEEE